MQFANYCSWCNVYCAINWKDPLISVDRYKENSLKERTYTKKRWCCTCWVWCSWFNKYFRNKTFQINFTLPWKNKLATYSEQQVLNFLQKENVKYIIAFYEHVITTANTNTEIIHKGSDTLMKYFLTLIPTDGKKHSSKIKCQCHYDYVSMFCLIMTHYDLHYW